MKKKRREGEAAANGQDSYNTSLSDLDAQNHNHKRKKKKKKTNKFIPTVSIALPGSIIDNVQTPELKTRLAGQIARAATIFRIDEVIIFDNKGASVDDSVVTELEDANGNESGASFLVRILQYLETPQYLRRSLFPKHNSLRFVGLLPPLDAPHHLRKHEWAPYREGITLNEEPPNSVGTLVDVGLNKYVVVDQKLEPGIRVTVAMGTNRDLSADCFRKVVLSSEPREEMGLYWGYKVRYAPSFSYVFKHCPYEGGYDHLIGTSEHGLVVTSSELTIPAFSCSLQSLLLKEWCEAIGVKPEIYGHLLIAFGGLAGLEENIEEDANFKVKDVRHVFNTYLNTCPNQGSRTIRTEEAVFISLQFFQEPVKRAMQGFEER